MWESIFFWFFGGLAALLALMVITFKNPVHSALCLIGNLFCVAALYVLLDAHFLAAVQILVYAGAILVLFIFVIMLINLKKEELGKARQTATKIVGASIAGLVFVILVPVISQLGISKPVIDAEKFGTIEVVGRMLFNKYVLSFEVASIILLVAIVGAISIAKKKAA